jgi:urease accessory protein
VSAHAELPLLVQRPLRGPGGEAVLVLLTPAAALFEGDRLQLEVTCGPRTNVTLTTVGATRVNRCETARIQVQTRVHVGAHATFRYLPHELIPFRGANYRQSMQIEMDSGARVWLMEVVAPFEAARLEFETEVRDNGSTSVRERFTLARDRRAQLGAYTHYGSMLLCGANYDREQSSTLNRQLAARAPALQAGASALPHAGTGVKALGHSAQSVRQALLNAADCPNWLLSMVGQ